MKALIPWRRRRRRYIACGKPIIGRRPEQGFFHYLVDQARAALGADIAWVLLTRDGESELIVAESSSAPLRQAAQAMHVALAAGGMPSGG